MTGVMSQAATPVSTPAADAPSRIAISACNTPLEDTAPRLRASHRRRRNRKSTHYSESDISDIVESSVSNSTCYRNSYVDRTSTEYEEVAGNKKQSDQSGDSAEAVDELYSFSRRRQVMETFKGPSPPLEETRLAPPRRPSNLDRPQEFPLQISKNKSRSEASLDEQQGSNSSFYAEPFDSVQKSTQSTTQSVAYIVRRVRRREQIPKKHRFSDPSIQLPQLLLDIAMGGLEPISSSQEDLPLSASMDNLTDLKRRIGKESQMRAGSASRENGGSALSFSRSRLGSQKGIVKGKPVKVPEVTETLWQADSSWEFLNQDSREARETSEEKFGARVGGPVFDQSSRSSVSSLDQNIRRSPPASQPNASNSDPPGLCTIDELIFTAFPSLKLPERRISQKLSRAPSEAGTDFSEPWDSSRWEPVLKTLGEDSIHYLDNPDLIEQLPGYEKMNSNRCFNDEQTSVIQVTGEGFLDDNSSLSDRSVKQSNKPFRENLEPFLSPPRLHTLRRNTGHSFAGAVIDGYVHSLAAAGDNTFAKSISHFITCTKESSESSPFIVMRNMRQFMTGIKNYLVKHGEGDFISVVEKERNQLKETEFLNLDAILESVMHNLVISPLREHLHSLFVDEFWRKGLLAKTAESIRIAREMSPEELGIHNGTPLPNPLQLKLVRDFLLRMEQVNSPMVKLENLLGATMALFMAVKPRNRDSTPLQVDDFLPLLVYAIVEAGVLGLEVEIEWIWGLVHPSLHAGEGGYYLALWSGALHVLKGLATDSSDPSKRADRCPLSDQEGFLRVLVPDEQHGSILVRTLPVRPSMSTAEISRIVAHKLHITNPQEYALFRLVEGEEVLLSETDLPQVIKADALSRGKKCSFVYKRIDANLALPNVF
ncbi:unnamed protein product [Cyprideis torosa]|uniref:Uncharacterized protein n=1 Tax=Cyprideis torosa TaxID=163714 RepID=A0A7R8W3D1_9CRUS|nr:unnamed protein product [Cyprideis torosa]CAG0882884.1 unnamed protein product [Cyprideis torosa]